MVKNKLGNDPELHNVIIQGEVSNARQQNQGSLYFTLKDSNSQMNCIMFPNYLDKKTKAVVTNGKSIIARGNITLYAQTGCYQFQCISTEDFGLGLMYKEFIELKEKLSRQGLFDSKKAIPKFCYKLGIATSLGNEALQDVIKVSTSRFKGVHLYVADCTTQGLNASESIIKALKYLDEFNLHAILLTRGGGTFEQLSAYNNEELAYVLHNMKTPVITGIAHQSNYTIADYVCIRAASPSHAAELVTPDFNNILISLNLIIHSINENILKYLEDKLRELSGVCNKIINETKQFIFQKQYDLLKLKPVIQQNSPATLLCNSINNVSSLYANVSNLLKSNIVQYSNILSINKIFFSHSKEVFINKLQDINARIKYSEIAKVLYQQITNKRIEVNALKQSIDSLLTSQIKTLKDAVYQCKSSIEILSPLQTINRGYSLLIDNKTNKTIVSSKELAVSTEVKIVLKSETILAKINIQKIEEEKND